MIKKQKTKGKKSNLPSLISLAIIVIALAITVILVQRPQDLRNQAAMETDAGCKIKTKKCYYLLGGFIKITYQCYDRTECEVKITNKKPTPTKRPTSTPRPTPITCKNPGGICVTLKNNQITCPTNYHYIGRYGTDCSSKTTRYCCMPN